MIAVARARYLRVSPVKVRQVIDLIRGKDVTSCVAILTHVEKGCAKMVGKVLHSAVSTAKQKGLLEDQLFISKIQANHGPMGKRFRAAAFGRATSILKRTTHLTIELDLMVRRARSVNAKTRLLTINNPEQMSEANASKDGSTRSA